MVKAERLDEIIQGTAWRVKGGLQPGLGGLEDLRVEGGAIVWAAKEAEE